MLKLRYHCFVMGLMQGETLTMADLEAIPAFGKLLISRASRLLSHADTLDECKRLAALWLNSPDAQIPDSDFTGESYTGN